MFGKLGHSILTVIGVVCSIASPVLTAAIVAHPHAALILGGIWAVIGHFMPSPVQHLWDRIPH
jgi:hypothetical protein